MQELHAHLQPLLLFFVDAASLISPEDDKWDIFLALEEAGDGCVEVLGFVTTYSFYVFPDRSRLRLSQILVLPNQQGRGAGGMLLKAVYAHADKANVVDITVRAGESRGGWECCTGNNIWASLN